ncbi:hypothetical protein NGB58_27780, partial [Escherichia coli]|nr:hypothetical protein [Escherichia coli]
MNAFIREQSSALADMENRSRQNATQQARAWIFRFSGNHRSAASEMMKDIPAPDAVHTAAIMFVADS